MSGLETAIRNALEKSERSNPDVRARIYQSARQALDAGLKKQGISDEQVVLAQHQRLEQKIREIEFEERKAVAAAASTPAAATPPAAPRVAPAEAPAATSPAVSPAASPIAPPVSSGVSREAPRSPASRPQDDAPLLGGATRDASRDISSAPGVASASGLDSLRAARDIPFEARQEPQAAPLPVGEARDAKRPRDETLLETRPERTAKPRRRRGFLSVLLAWLVFFILVGLAAWWAYSSGLVQQSLQQALDAAERTAGGPSSDLGSRGPQNGFSEAWTEVFSGGNANTLEGGAAARLEPVAIQGTTAARVMSGASTAEGDVSIPVPAEILQELAGKSSTIALTVQSAAEAPVQFSVRCDFGSLGACPRHRFTARQERADVLLRVTFERSIAPNAPGRLVVNTGLDGAEAAILLHSVRVLPGQ
ncbi:regulator [Pseudorhizobium halotolerans]|uniref:Regulator n=1 Tax=Pseudorhizobium halotolerans TaxID=1233081 RepID=A0ABN7JQM9_9HYPH|nr:regulator [Pseudorhizobium halotolerans]CAD7043087.1 regulator [Pseudorhizobium halotolerans]